MTQPSNRQLRVTSDFDVSNNKIVNVATPTSANDAANKAYVDAQVQGLDIKASVRATSLSNITSTGTQTIDGVALNVGDRVLLKNQTLAQNNGIWVVATGAWTRSADADSSQKVTSGFYTYVEEGSQAGQGWVLTTTNPITLGTTGLAFTQFNGANSITAGNGLAKVGNTLSVNPATNGGIQSTASGINIQLADSTLQLGASGLKLASLPNGQILVGNVSGVATAVSISGDATLSNSGVLTLASTVVKTSNLVKRETPSGAVDGSNVVFTLAFTPVATSEEVFLNGLLQDVGAGNDYTISGATITFASAPQTGDKIRVNYQK